MKAVATGLEGVLLMIGNRAHEDSRGVFRELWRESQFADLGITERFVQDNVSVSAPHVLRGLHFQYERPQGKLVSVAAGRIFDVAVDIRPGSPTFGTWVGEELSAANGAQLWIPRGFAHGFYAIEPSVVIYKCSDYYHAGGEGSLRWNDPAVGIDWPGAAPLISEKDAAAPSLSELDLKRLASVEYR